MNEQTDATVFPSSASRATLHPCPASPSLQHYHTAQTRLTRYSEVEPSLAPGFYCPTEEALEVAIDMLTIDKVSLFFSFLCSMPSHCLLPLSCFPTCLSSSELVSLLRTPPFEKTG